LPHGNRLVVVTNGGGPGIIAADASARHGLTLPEISEQTKTTLKSAVQRDISLGNPLDLTAGASADEFEAVLKILASDQDIDMALAIFVPPIVTAPEAMQESIRRVAPLFQRNGKPLVCCFFGQHGMQGKVGGSRRSVPSYLFPEEAVLALAKAVQYSELNKRRRGIIPKIRGIQREKGRRLVEQAMSGNAQRPLWLPADTIFSLLNCYGMRALQTVIARTPSEAARTASEIGFPVAVKLNSSTIVHKTDVGAVMLDLKSAGEVEKAFEDIRSKLKAVGRDNEMQGVVVQPMIAGGMEVIAGVTQDPSFGPLIMFGTGGVYAEIFNDIAVRLHPLTDLDARELIHSVKMAKLFEGFRGTPAVDTDSVKDLLLRLSALVEDIPQIAELDLNPVRIMARGGGYWIVDSRILVR
jgi:acetyltransferase